MNKERRSKLQAALKNQPVLQISEAHRMQTIEAARIEYRSRRQRERIRYPAFLLRQVRFIGAPVWLLQGLMLLCACWFFGFALTAGLYGLVSRHLPLLLCCFAVFIAMTGIPFLGRSAKYRMLEVELATRISLPGLLLTRILLVGASDTLLLGVALLLVGTGTELEAGSVAAYLLLPYLVACCGCLFIQVQAHGRYRGFVCTAFCFLLVALLFMLYRTFPQVYEQALLGIWGVLCAVCVPALLAEVYRLLKKAGSLDFSPPGVL